MKDKNELARLPFFRPHNSTSHSPQHYVGVQLVLYAARNHFNGFQKTNLFQRRSSHVYLFLLTSLDTLDLGNT